MTDGTHKVLVLVPGHDARVLEHPMTLKLIENATAWLND